MAVTIRKATAGDAPEWVRLFRESFGDDYIGKQVYDPNWAAGQLAGPAAQETWVAEHVDKLRGSISVLSAVTPNTNPVANLGRFLARPDDYGDGSAEALLREVCAVCAQRRQMAVIRVPAVDNVQQTLLEKLGFVCVGFQPSKHLCRTREGILFYVRLGAPDTVDRLPLSHSLPQVRELAAAALRNLKFSNPQIVRDGVTGYPLQSDLKIDETTADVFEASRLAAQAVNPPVEISGVANRGLGMMRIPADMPGRALLAQRDGKVVAGLSFYFDEHDKYLRLVDSFATDDLSTGALMQQALKQAQKMSAVYVEADFLATAPRLLKTAEQLGFVPVAFLPGFFNRDARCVDVVKMAKLNAVYSSDHANLTPHARATVDIVDRNFQDQKVGVAVINLLRGLPVFNGLGDGELGKMARLFTQKLYRAGEKIFGKGDSGDSAYIVVRGQIDICLEENTRPVASIGSGAIIGEQAFLDGAPRIAFGIAAQPSILLVVQRSAFNNLVQNEPHLGMVVMRNIAVEVSNKLRRADAAITRK